MIDINKINDKETVKEQIAEWWKQIITYKKGKINMEKKLCPIMSKREYSTDEECKQEECEIWSEEFEGCSYRINAESNAEAVHYLSKIVEEIINGRTKGYKSS